ncbi:MAG: hypothetical protein SPH68_06400 [Candidatus Borkfalkiaceae bacterium]|nr:hypothetical protein [Clostridia bacterium]MDY6223768.1 hypothetical protein [Christensenellaceae bacterium]
MNIIAFCAGDATTAPFSQLSRLSLLNSLRLPRGILLTSSLVTGFWAAAGLFALSFFIIHLFRWAIAFYLQKRKSAREKPAPPPPREQRAPEKPPEKIYYIVERKKKRESSKYTEPKEFRFK